MASVEPELMESAADVGETELVNGDERLIAEAASDYPVLPEFIPSANDIDVTPTKDGGVWKLIKREGTGETTPNDGDKVHVHYVGTLLDGTKFDSSRDRGELFEFTLGTGVIKGWSIGVATMKKGELAVLTCKAEYAYGKRGSPPKIPPNSTLSFEIELVSWKGEDVSEDSDGGVLKSIKTKAEGYSRPNEGARCEVHILGRFEGRVFEDRDVAFTNGLGFEAGLVPGVEHAISKMKQGERAVLSVLSRHAYGTTGSSEHNIPPGADLEYEVELKNFEKVKESWEMDLKEKLEQAEMAKVRGTEAFKHERYATAAKHYAKIDDYLKGEETVEGENGEKRNALLLASHLNLALCYLKVDETVKARDQCDKALELSPKNEKALFRRGLALVNMQEYENALKDFNAVIELDPLNKAAKNQIILAREKSREAHEREKKIYKGMFEKFAKVDSIKTPEKTDDQKGTTDGTANNGGEGEHEMISSCGENEIEKKVEGEKVESEQEAVKIGDNKV